MKDERPVSPEIPGFTAMVVDDELPTLAWVGQLLRNSGRVTVSGMYDNPLEGLRDIRSGKPDLVFLDIEMPGMNGLELAELLSADPLPPEVVFITAYNRYALEAFKVNAVDYLLKPVLEGDLKHVLDRIELRRSRVSARFSQTGMMENNEGSSLVSMDAMETGEVGQPFGGVNDIRLFGTFQMQTGSPPARVRFATAKAESLLGWLLTSRDRGGVPKWQLIDAFWPDRDDEKGDVNLRSTVFRLNRTLRECGAGMRVVPTHGGYELEGDPVITDLETYYRMMQSRDMKGLAEWLAHWDGQFLEDIADPWAGTLRERVRLQVAEAGRLVAEEALAGRFSPWDALTAVEAVWKQEPYDESLQTALMRLLRKTRGRDAVMVWYHGLVLQLREELGVPPTMEVENTYRKMSLD